VSAGVTHSVSAFNGTCYGPVTTVSINTQPVTPATPAVSVTQPNCTTTTGTITVTSPTGAGYFYSIDGVTYTNTTGVFSGVGGGSYNVTVYNGSCYSTAVPVTINTPSTTPAAPTALVLTPGSGSITGTFTAPSPAPDHYLVIRTSTSAAPSAPANQTVYTVGTNALGGYIAAITTTPSFTDNTTVPGTTYWYWIYSYNSLTCVLYSPTDLSGSAAANSCSGSSVLYWAGAGTTIPGGNSNSSTNLQFNNPVNWSTTSSSYAVSANAPVTCNDVVMNISNSASQTIPLSVATTVNSLTINLTGSATNIIDAGAYTLVVNGNTSISAGASGSSKAYLTTEGGSIVIYGTATIGASGDAGSSYIGNGDGTTAGGVITFKGNTIFNANGAVFNPSYVSAVFDGSGAQTLTNNSSGANSVSFHDVQIGNANTPALTFAGSTTGYSYVNGGNLTVSPNSSLTLPSGATLNQATASTGVFSLGAGAALTVGGGASAALNAASGSNFPGGFSTYTFDCTSTTIYNGATQTVFGGSSYGNLTISTAGTKTAGGNLSICSNVLINSGATFNGSTFSHTVGGNWSNNGTFTANTSTVTFNGTIAAQTIGGSSSTSFSGLAINNANGVTLIDASNPGVNKTVTGLLTLTNGLLTTDASDLLVMTSTASTNVGAPTTGTNYYTTASYVNGPLQRTGSTSFTFPVGKSGTGYVPIGISAMSNNSTQTFTAEYFHTSAETLGPIGPATPPLVHVSGCDYWRLDLGSTYPATTNNSLPGGVTANITLYWNPNNGLNCSNPYVTNTVDLAIAHLNFVSGQSYSGLWVPISPGAAYNWGDGTGINTTNNSISYAGASTFSPFSLATTNGSDNPLIIKLLYFTAVKATGYNKLSWKAECTDAPASFVLERSSDGVSFSGIDSVTAGVAADCSTAFNYPDYTSSGPRVYYRLKMTDASGNVTYSEIRLILNDANVFELLNIRPNPVEGEAWLNVSSSQSDKVELVIYSVDGREIQRKTVQVPAGSSTINMQTAALAKGMYVIRGIFSSGQSNTIPFIKQ